MPTFSGVRTLLALALLPLAACSSHDTPGNQTVTATPSPRPTASYPADDTVACATGTAPLTQRCGVEQTAGPDGTVLTLRRPDGGFRRLLIARDGHGVVTADGAVPAKVTIVAPGEIEVVVADEHYRLPATVRP